MRTMRSILTSQPPSQMELWAKSVERRSLELTRTNRQLRTSVDKYKKVRGVETLAASMQTFTLQVHLTAPDNICLASNSAGMPL